MIKLLIQYQVFFCIYFPVWVTLFIPNPKQQTLMLTFLVLGVPLGVIIGYILTSLIIIEFNVSSFQVSIL